MPYVCAYPARRWTCDSSVAMATRQQALPGSLVASPWIPEVGLCTLWVSHFSARMTPAEAQNFRV